MIRYYIVPQETANTLSDQKTLFEFQYDIDVVQQYAVGQEGQALEKFQGLQPKESRKESYLYHANKITEDKHRQFTQKEKSKLSFTDSLTKVSCILCIFVCFEEANVFRHPIFGSAGPTQTLDMQSLGYSIVDSCDKVFAYCLTVLEGKEVNRDFEILNFV